MKKIIWVGLLCSATALYSGCQSPPGVGVLRSKGLLTFAEHGQPLLVYNHSAMTHKPYVQMLCTPSGVNVLRDQVADHLHHHGLMLAWSVNGVNFWEESSGCGYQSPGSPAYGVRSEQTGARYRLSHESRWLDAEKTNTMLTEQRLLTTRLTSKSRAAVTTWTSVFSVPSGQDSLRISGRHFDGLGMRFVESMDSAAEFVYSTGQPGPVFRGEERLTEADWCACRAVADGKPVTVAMFNDPANPRPATWFTMSQPFAYLSATMRLHETPIQLQPGRDMTLRFGIALWDGHPADSDIETIYRDWLRERTNSEKQTQ